MRRMTTVEAIVARCRVDSVHVLTKDSAVKHIGHAVKMSVSGYRGWQFKSRHQYVVSLSKALYLHCFSRLSCEMSARWENLVKGVQCYEFSVGIALTNHAFCDRCAAVPI